MYYIQEIRIKIQKYIKFIRPLLKLYTVVVGMGLAVGVAFKYFNLLPIGWFHIYMWLLIALIISVLIILAFWHEDYDTKFIRDV